MIGAVGSGFETPVLNLEFVFDLDRDTIRFFRGAITAPPSVWAVWAPTARDIKLGFVERFCVEQWFPPMIGDTLLRIRLT